MWPLVIDNLDKILDVALTVIAWLASRPLIAGWKAKAQAAANAAGLQRALVIAQDAVVEAEKTLVADARKKGKIDKETAAVAYEAARKLVVDRLSAEGLSMLVESAPRLVELALAALKARGVIKSASPFLPAASSVVLSGPELPNIPGM